MCYSVLCVLCLIAQLCPTLCDPMDYSPPGSSVHRVLQARILEWIAMLSPRGSSQPRDWTQVSCLAGRFFTVWATIIQFHSIILGCSVPSAALISDVDLTEMWSLPWAHSLAQIHPSVLLSLAPLFRAHHKPEIVVHTCAEHKRCLSWSKLWRPGGRGKGRGREVFLWGGIWTEPWHLN